MTERRQTEMHRSPGFLGSVGRWLTDMNIYVFFLFIFIYHVIVIFQGLDFNDEGFHLAFYQQIFDNPDSVQYAFWGWLSGIVGGTFMKLFPFMGVFGIRLLGAVVSTATIVVTYNLLKKYVHLGYLKVSIIMLSLFINGDAKNLYYNNLSAFLYFLVAFFLFKGLRDNKKWFILVAGLFAGLNIFTRLPNVLAGVMILSIVYWSYLKKETLKVFLIRSSMFLMGMVSACLCVYIAMMLLNHLKYFAGSLEMLFSSSSHASGDDGLNGAYGIVRLLRNNLIDYAKSLRFVVVLALVVLLLVFIQNRILSTTKSGRKIFRFVLFLLVPASIMLVYSGWFTSYRLIEFFTGVSLLSVFVLFDKRTPNELRLLTFIGGLILLIHPFGSSEGILTVVVYSMWISFPLSVYYLIYQLGIKNESGVKMGNDWMTMNQIFQNDLYRRICLTLLCVISFAAVYNVYRFPYLCDTHQRKDMRFSVKSKFMMGIFTSKGRAEAIDDLLAASAQYIKPGDYVLAYDCMPLYHYLTETRSYVRNPCIWFYPTGLFEKELNSAGNRIKKLPVIVRQLILTTGDGSGWPEVTPTENYLDFKRTQGKNRILDKFISSHNYQEVWRNSEFEILICGNK